MGRVISAWQSCPQQAVQIVAAGGVHPQADGTFTVHSRNDGGQQLVRVVPEPDPPGLVWFTHCTYRDYQRTSHLLDEAEETDWYHPGLTHTLYLPARKHVQAVAITMDIIEPQTPIVLALPADIPLVLQPDFAPVWDY